MTLVELLDRLKEIKASNCCRLGNYPGPFKEPIGFGVDEAIAAISEVLAMLPPSSASPGGGLNVSEGA